MSISSVDATGHVWAAVGLAAFAVILSQAGFVFLEVGHSRTRNVKSFIAKHFFAFYITILVWWFWGYGFALDTHKYTAMLFEGDENQQNLRWFVYFSWAVVAASILSGAVTDRMKMWVYGVVTVTLVGVTFPLLVNWQVVQDGWMRDEGVIDWAGAGYIHLMAGTASLICAWAVGARPGRFVLKAGQRTVVDVLPYDTLAATTGSCIVIFALFNLIYLSSVKYSTGGVQADGQDYTRAIIMAAIAMGSSGLFSTLTLCATVKRYQVSLQLLNNSLLGGLVAISCCCGNCDAQGAFFIGMGSGIVAFFGPNFALQFGIDDPRDTVTVHMWQAVWGLFAAGLWASKELTFSSSGGPTDNYGAFYSNNGVLLGYQCMYICVTVLFTAAVTSLTLLFCSVVSHTLFAGPGEGLRVPPEGASKEVSTEFPYLYEQAYGQSAIPPGFVRPPPASTPGNVVNMQK